MTLRFLDTNILLRYLTKDDPEKATRALALLLRVERGEERVVTSSLVIFETVWTLQKYYRLPRTDIRDRLLPVLRLRGVHLVNKRVYIEALERFALTTISFADVFNSVYLASLGVSEIYSWDTDFDRIPGITRIEPEG